MMELAVRKPLIGIGGDVAPSGERFRAFAWLSYVDALERAGAVPVIIPPQSHNIEAFIESLDGVLLAGGADCDPAAYGEEAHHTVQPMDPRRQSNDLSLASLARDRGVPTLGICLGMQVMNVAAGGTLIQDIASHHVDALGHDSLAHERARHDVEVHEGTRLAAIVGEGAHNVNSSHHQAIRRTGRELVVAAAAPDGIVEAIEDPHHPFFVGVQWHPEDMEGESCAVSIFSAFVDAARLFAEKKKQHP